MFSNDWYQEYLTNLHLQYLLLLYCLWFNNDKIFFVYGLENFAMVCIQDFVEHMDFLFRITPTLNPLSPHLIAPLSVSWHRQLWCNFSKFVWGGIVL